MNKVLAWMAIFLCFTAFQPTAVRAQEMPLAEVGSYTDDARSARIAALRETYRIVLSDREKELVAARCLTAQKALAKIGDRFTTTRSGREKTYASVIAALTNLKLRFENAGVDASNLDLLIVNYQQKNTNFQLTASEYETVLEDATAIDCTSDPVGFRAVLEGVRATRKDIVSISAEITEMTKSTMPTTFDSLKLRLSTSEVQNGE